jgi:hypothetical protein
MKKISAILTAVAMLFSFTACNSGNEPEKAETTTTESIVSDYETETDGITETNDITETTDTTDVTVEVTDGETESTTSAAEKTTVAAVSNSSSDPSKWSKEEIVDFYK